MAKQGWKAKLLLVVISLVVGLVIAELALRLTGYSRPYFYAFDNNLGWVLRPGLAAWSRKEGNAYVRINGGGARDDREYLVEKPRDTFRVAVIGDSFAEAMQVSTPQTFWSVLGAELGNCPALSGKRVEVLNFGVSSYGTAQELIMLRERVWNFSPDAVVLAFTPVNDVRNNSRVLERDDLRPYFILQNGALTPDMSFRNHPRFKQKETRLNEMTYRLINRLVLLQLINGLREDRQLRQSAAQSQTVKGDAEIGVEDKVYVEPNEPAWEEAWKVTEALIAQMNTEVKARGAKFTLVTVTSGPQTNPDPEARKKLMTRLGVNDLFYAERRLEQLAARENFAVLTLAPVFVKYADDHRAALHGFGEHLNVGHWNLEGHRLAGRTIGERMCGQLIETSKVELAQRKN